MSSFNYVKFVRGTAQAFASLANKDVDTLYFISEPNATKGALYLGDKLISGGDLTSSVTLDKISDIVLSESGVANGSLLVYNSETGKWENKTVEAAVATFIGVMEGASAEKDGASGLVPQPKIGDEGKFLRGDGTWVNPVTALENEIKSIAHAEVVDLIDGAPEDLDTLKEIVDWVQENGSVEAVVKLENRTSDLEDIINGTPAKIDEETGDVVTPAVPGLADKITYIESALKWTELE